MVRKFIKTPFGLLILLFLFSSISSLIFAVLGQISFLVWPIRILEYSATILFIILYTLYIYKDRFSLDFKLRVGIYTAIILYGVILALILTNSLLNTPSILKLFNIDYPKLFINPDGSEVSGFSLAAGGLLVSPLVVIFQYIILTIGNGIGVWLMKKRDKAA